MLYIKNTYILKLLLNVVTARIKALIEPEYTFLYVCVKEVLPPMSSTTFNGIIV
jgi:hypothetical protein